MNAGKYRLLACAACLFIAVLALVVPARAGLGIRGESEGEEDPSAQDFAPLDVAAGSDGSIYAVDSSDHDVDVYGAPTGEPGPNARYDFQSSFAGSGSTEGNLFFPVGIAAAEGSIYIADTFNYRVSQFSNDGAHIRSWGENGGTVDGQFLEPQRIALDSSGNVYVSDGRRNDIQKFSSTGTFLMGFKTETPDGPLAKAGGVAIAPDGSIYVTDEIGNRVVKYDAAGNFVSELEGGDLRNPVDIAIDSKGIVYVLCSHEENQAVQVFDASGIFKFEFGEGLWNFPKGIAVDAKTDDIWIADTSNGKLRVYGQLRPDVGIRGDQSTAQFRDKEVRYLFNGFNQVVPCQVEADGVMTVPVRNHQEEYELESTFRLTKVQSNKKIAISKDAGRAAAQAIGKSKLVTIKIKFRIICPDSEPVVKSLNYKVPD